MPNTIDERLTRILDAARWAPSGDNTQPWRFALQEGLVLVVEGSDTRDWCVYDLEGRASQLAVGALLESLALAATREGLEAVVSLLPESTDRAPRVRVRFRPAATVTPDPLAAFLERRTTQRRPMSWSALRPADRAALEAAPGPGYRVLWVEGTGAKARMARLLFRNAGIRLTIREAYEVHRRIIQWHSDFSEDRIPDRALGLNPAAVALMRWAMQSWERVSFLNRYLAGTLLPRIEMDVLPALGCAAHFFLIADQPPEDLAGYLAGGRAVQRFWLTTTALGLQFQPEMTPLIFSNYSRHGVPFSTDARARRLADRLRADLADLIGLGALDAAVFAGRVGYGPDPRWRSLRLPVERLWAS